MSDAAKPKYVYKEGGKIRQVTHWDMDYLPKDEIEALYRPAIKPIPRGVADPARRPTPRLALALMGVGMLLLLFSVGLASRL